jgi:hypothetical protein
LVSPCTAGTEVNLTGDLLTKRWGGVEKAAKNPGQKVLDMVRVVLGRLGGSTAFLGKFKAAFKESDATFQMSGNDLELSVLAGSALCWIFSQKADEADEASLALLSAVSIAKAPEWCEPFVSHATAYLDGRLRELRKPPTFRQPQLTTKKLKQQFDFFAAKLAENQPPQTSEAAKQLCEAMLQTISTATEAAATGIDQLARQSDLRRQETDVLWWLTAGVSRDLGETFKRLKTPAAAIIAGKELADLVSPPGILPAKSILQSIIPSATGKTAGKPIPLYAAVNATDAAWRQSLVGGLAIDRVTDLCPLLAAVKYSLTTDEADGWTGAYRKAYGLDPKKGLQPVELAHEIHRECLLAKLAAEE